jgi:hypothetical protein
MRASVVRAVTRAASPERREARPHPDQISCQDSAADVDGCVCGGLEIQVPQPAITHTVTVHQLERWTNGSAVRPDARIGKARLKAILSGTGE